MVPPAKSRAIRGLDSGVVVILVGLVISLTYSYLKRHRGRRWDFNVLASRYVSD